MRPETAAPIVTDEDLAEWRRLCDAATPGPWDSELDEETHELTINAGSARTLWSEPCELGISIGAPPSSWLTTDRILDLDLGSEGDADIAQREADADFIAAARTALPTLLDEIERLRAGLAALPETVEDELVQALAAELETDSRIADEWSSGKIAATARRLVKFAVLPTLRGDA